MLSSFTFLFFSFTFLFFLFVNEKKRNVNEKNVNCKKQDVNGKFQGFFFIHNSLRFHGSGRALNTYASQEDCSLLSLGTYQKIWIYNI